MTDQDKSTIAELAEVIADQNERIRLLTSEIDEQNDIIVDYELDQENEERCNASLYADLKAIVGGDVYNGEVCEAVEDILIKYFGEFE
jgi:hypothetical protein